MSTSKFDMRSSTLQVRYDRGPSWRARIGFVLPGYDDLIEQDIHPLAPTGVGVFFTRIPAVDDCTPEILMTMEKDLEDAASRFVPKDGLDVVCFACTAASALIGEERVNAALSQGAPTAKPTSLIGGVLQALRTFQAQRIVVATPYLDEINDLEAKYLQEQGFDVLDIQGMNILSGADMYRVAPDYIFEYARNIDRPDADAIFISCGGLRSLEIVDTLEKEVGKPVVVSNQAMFWNTLRLAGIEDKIKGYGRLFREH